MTSVFLVNFCTLTKQTLLYLCAVWYLTQLYLELLILCKFFWSLICIFPNYWFIRNSLRKMGINCKLKKISPVGDWRSTSLEWPWPWPWFRPYGIPSCITHRPLPMYQISLRSEEKFFWKSPLRFWSTSESRDTKTRTNQKSGPIKFRYCALV